MLHLRSCRTCAMAYLVVGQVVCVGLEPSLLPLSSFGFLLEVACHARHPTPRVQHQGNTYNTSNDHNENDGSTHLKLSSTQRSKCNAATPKDVFRKRGYSETPKVEKYSPDRTYKDRASSLCVPPCDVTAEYTRLPLLPRANIQLNRGTYTPP